ncbi:MAG: hypothetical protein ACTSV5_13365 [Promethearchaeota archaeon]
MEPILERNLLIKDVCFYISLFKLHKSYLLLLSDQKEMGIGSVTLSSPSLVKGIKTSSSSYALFGIENKIANKVIVERVANLLNTPVLLLSFLKTKIAEEDFIKPVMVCLNEMVSILHK